MPTYDGIRKPVIPVPVIPLPGAVAEPIIPPHQEATVISYLLRDQFTTALTAGNVNATAAEPGPGTRTVVDTNSILTLSAGKLAMATGGSTSDPGLWLDGLARTAGRVLLVEHYGSAGLRCFGWDDAQSAAVVDTGFYIQSTIRATTTGGQTGFTFTYATGYSYAVVLRTAGGYFFVKISGIWYLLWMHEAGSDATMYPAAGGRDIAVQYDDLRVPDLTWFPTPLCYDTFTGSNGTSLDAHTSNAAGPDSQTALTETWAEKNGAWTIESNHAASPATGPGVPGSVATVSVSAADVWMKATVTANNAGTLGLCFRYSDNDNFWYFHADASGNEIVLTERNSASNTDRGSTIVSISSATDYTLQVGTLGNDIQCRINSAQSITETNVFNQTATQHGLWASNDNLAGGFRFDAFHLFARGTDGDYSDLDDY